MKVEYFFRAPRYPVLIKIGGQTVLLMNHEELEATVEKYQGSGETECPMVDYNWEGWTCHAEQQIVAPSFTIRRYTKKAFLEFCNTPKEQIERTNLNRYTRQQIFDYMINNVKHG